MKITPLAADSMGTRSMATFVETAQRKILIDPGADLGVLRYGLPPHELEEFQLGRHLERIRLYAESAQIIIITQFVREHFYPDASEMYREKVLFIKNPNQDIPHDQRARAFTLLEEIKGFSKEVFYADGRSFEMGGLKLIFSTPRRIMDLETPTYSLPLSVQEGEVSFLFSSECMGLFDETMKRFVIKNNPEILYLDGPAGYLQQADSGMEIWKQFRSDFEALLEVSTIKQIILDHHFTRDLHWEKRMKDLEAVAARRGVALKTAAELRGEQNDTLEARRRELHDGDKNRPAVSQS